MRSFAAACTAAVLSCAAAPALAIEDAPRAEPPECAPSPARTGELLRVTYGDGLAAWYRVPADYAAKRGVTLLLLFHDAGEDRRAGFRDHPPETSFTDALVVSPDGPTRSGGGGFAFRRADVDLARIESLHHQFLTAFNVKACFVAGRGSGANFAFEYAGANPDLVAGVVAHAGQIDAATRWSERGRPQAIALLHGCDDAAVLLARMNEAAAFYRERGHEHVRALPLRGMAHEPAPRTTEALLAWCEGMTSDDPERVTAAFAALERDAASADRPGLYQVATRLSTLSFARNAAQERARHAAQEVAARAQRHVAGFEAARKKAKDRLGPWFGHMVAFLDGYEGVPARDELYAGLKERLARERDQAGEARAKYDELAARDVPRAFVAGCDVVAKGPLAREFADGPLLETLRAWRKDAKALDIPSTSTRMYDKVVPPYLDALAAGAEAFAGIEAE